MYVLSKHEAEQRVLSAVRGGLPATIVNPAAMIGAPADGRPMGGLAARAAAGRLRFAPPGGSSVADVGDVAGGIVLALDRGRAGRRYLLGGENRTWFELATELARAHAVRGPIGTFPVAMGRAAQPFARALDAVRLSRPPWAPERFAVWGWYTFVDGSRAREELGYAPRAIAEGIERCAVPSVS